MKRTYLALAGLTLAAAAGPALLPPLGRAAGLFSAQPVDSSRFAVLAKPVGSGEWNLLVLEQLRPSPACWQSRSDGLVDPSLNRFNYTGICARYLDSNGYSLRAGDQDLGARQRLRLQPVGSTLQLQALDPEQGTVLVVGRAQVPRRDRDGFVAIQLDPGWELQRRSYGRQQLNHLYFANATPIGELLARNAGPPSLMAPPPPGAPPAVQARLLERPSARGGRVSSRLDEALSGPGLTRTPVSESRPGTWSTARPGQQAASDASLPPPGRAVALQVIPFSD
jgi:hypothetical protein